MGFSKAECSKYTHCCSDHYRDEDIKQGQQKKTLRKGSMPIFDIPKRVRFCKNYFHYYFCFKAKSQETIWSQDSQGSQTVSTGSQAITHCKPIIHCWLLFCAGQLST